MKRSGLKRKPKSVTPFDVAGALAWMEAARGRSCVLCGSRPALGHHILYQQWVPAHALWDQRNLLPLCGPCHQRHHSSACRVTMSTLREHSPEVFDLAWELGLQWRLDRHYPLGAA